MGVFQLMSWHPHVHSGMCFVVQDASSGEGVSAAVGTYSHRFHQATLALLPGTSAETAAELGCGALSSAGLPELLLMAHHSAITVGIANKRATWQVVARRLRGPVTTLLKGELS